MNQALIAACIAALEYLLKISSDPVEQERLRSMIANFKQQLA